jgi:hypothetical protein
VATWEEVGSTTTGREWVWRSFSDGWAIFSMLLAAMAVRKAVGDGWTV